MPRPAQSRWALKSDPSKSSYDSWISEEDAEQTLRQLCGNWSDQKGSIYSLTLDSEGTIEVCTTRPSGEVIRTPGLIRIEWRSDSGRIVWGRSGSRSQYTIAELDGSTLLWQRGGSAPFQWQRHDKPDEDEPEAEEASAKPSWQSVDKKAVAEEPFEGAAEFGERRARLRKELKEQRKELQDQQKLVAEKTSEDLNAVLEGETKALKQMLGLNEANATTEPSRPLLPDEGRDAGERLLAALCEGGTSSSTTASWQPDHATAAAAAAAAAHAAAAAALPQDPLSQSLLTQTWAPVPWGWGPFELQHIIATMEYYFSDTNLSNDEYLKSLMMPGEGWVSLVMLQTFPRMRMLGVDAWAIRHALTHSLLLEVDGTGFYLRIRDRLRREMWAPPPH